MSRTWNKEELAKASEYMVEHGWMSYEEFCKCFDGQNKEAEETGEKEE